MSYSGRQRKKLKDFRVLLYTLNYLFKEKLNMAFPDFKGREPSQVAGVGRQNSRDQQQCES